MAVLTIRNARKTFGRVVALDGASLGLEEGRRAPAEGHDDCRASGQGRLTGAGSAAGASMGVGVDVVDVMRSSRERGSLVSFYAAGIGVMFLLQGSIRCRE
jgi:hypothetical protein